MSLQERKRLGQFFTGLPLGRLLAAFAVRTNTMTVLDPMCGHGDLLDSVLEIAAERGVTLASVDGIEIEPVAANHADARIRAAAANLVESRIICGNAFDLRVLTRLSASSFDLVIANPPFVRYQRQSEVSGVLAPDAASVRADLSSFANQCPLADRDIWLTLAKGYSGHADLSVPAWLLSAMLVKPGGILALVVPSTWRSRDYAAVLRYVMVREFQVETVVEDEQPGWFPDALVRTQLVIARRLPAPESAALQGLQREGRSYRHVTLSPSLRSNGSLVGRAFVGPAPEVNLADELRDVRSPKIDGVSASCRSDAAEIEWLYSNCSGKGWFKEVEHCSDGPNHSRISTPDLPDKLLALLPQGSAVNADKLEDIGINVGQGLRTGCNDFFYVEVVSAVSAGNSDLVEARGLFPDQVFSVPRDALRVVLRKQFELRALDQGGLPRGRLLDLRDFVLPEDIEDRPRRAAGRKVMNGDLATFVRDAACLAVGEPPKRTPIPQLSAVRTNVRKARANKPARFWYMLPDFAPRHQPKLFVPRVNSGQAIFRLNPDCRFVIDANFSTIWWENANIAPAALCAVLNSTWCQACVELLGTPLGGGALKLEATQLRRLPIPSLSARDWKGVSMAIASGSSDQAVDRITLKCLGVAPSETNQVRSELLSLIEDIRRSRQRRT